MHSNKISTKTIARIAAVQTLYQYQLACLDQGIETIMQQMISFYQDERKTNHGKSNLGSKIKVKLSSSYFQSLVKSVVEHLKQIDDIIANHLADGWVLENLPVLLLSLLRVAVCELQFFEDVPSKVVINEFTDITSDMLSSNEVGFVNSILDTVAKENNVVSKFQKV